MKDNLKRYIQENREAFDSEIPSADIYGRITGFKTSPGIASTFVTLRWSLAAASVITLMMVLFFTWKKEKLPPTPVATESESLQYEEDPVYSVQIAQFKQIIDVQTEELKQLKIHSPELYNEFSRDIGQLDSAYRSLKNQLGENPNRETLLEAMLSNLQLQTELLTKQLSIIREIKQNKKNHETRI